MRLFIADKDKEVRVGLQILLHQEPGMVVTGVAEKAEGLLTQVEASRPDVLLLDWRLLGVPAAEELVDQLRMLNFPLSIIALSIRPEDRPAALAAGVDAFVGKIGPADELLVILRTLREEGIFLID
jgi:DNA-binding NarL/FixJ family response regulator